jgi:general secretion pathway protein M
VINIKLNRMTLSVGASVGCLVLLALYLVVVFWLLRQTYAHSIDNLTPRTARLQGLIDSEAQLADAAARVEDNLSELTWPGGRDTAMTAADLQQQVRDSIVAAGLTVSGSQILPAQAEHGFERLVLNITATGDIESLDEAIVSLRELRPVVLIETATVRPVRARRTSRRGGDAGGKEERLLSINMRLVSLRLLTL